MKTNLYCKPAVGDILKNHRRSHTGRKRAEDASLVSGVLAPSPPWESGEGEEGTAVITCRRQPGQPGLTLLQCKRARRRPAKTIL